MRTLLAKYDGSCVNCGKPIKAGIDRIDYYKRGYTSHVAHVDCEKAARERATREQDAAFDARYKIAQGPVMPDRKDAERVACAHYLASHGCYAAIVERRSSGLYFGRATFLGYEWFPCAEVTP